MIEKLDGLQETITFVSESLIKFYDNTDYESYPFHRHNSIEILMPIDGSYVVSCKETSFHIRQGDILIIQPNILHKMPAIHGRRFICQASLLPIYPLKMFKSVNMLLPSTMLITPETDPVLRDAIADELNNIHRTYNTIDKTAELSMYVSILHIFLLISKAYSDKIPDSGDVERDRMIHSSNIVAICDFINNHYPEKLTLEDVAKKTGYSKYHFERLFKEFTNQTFYQYLNRARINNAKLLIEQYNISIIEAANKSGFSSISSFVRMFKIHNNCTPSEFRNAKRCN